MEQLIARFHQIVKEFRGKGHDLLDYHNNKFDRDYVEFNVKISGVLKCCKPSRHRRDSVSIREVVGGFFSRGRSDRVGAVARCPRDRRKIVPRRDRAAARGVSERHRDATRPARATSPDRFQRRRAAQSQDLRPRRRPAFINQSSIENSLGLLATFQAIFQREALKSDLDSKLNVIFQNYGIELEQVQQLYEKQKHDPPHSSQSTSGRREHYVESPFVEEDRGPHEAVRIESERARWTGS